MDSVSPSAIFAAGHFTRRVVFSLVFAKYLVPPLPSPSPHCSSLRLGPVVSDPGDGGAREEAEAYGKAESLSVRFGVSGARGPPLPGRKKSRVWAGRRKWRPRGGEAAVGGGARVCSSSSQESEVSAVILPGIYRLVTKWAKVTCEPPPPVQSEVKAKKGVRSVCVPRPVRVCTCVCLCVPRGPSRRGYCCWEEGILGGQGVELPLPPPFLVCVLRGGAACPAPAPPPFCLPACPVTPFPGVAVVRGVLRSVVLRPRIIP